MNSALCRYNVIFVSCGSHSKQQLFHSTLLTTLSLQWRRAVSSVRNEVNLYVFFKSEDKTFSKV